MKSPEEFLSELCRSSRGETLKLAKAKPLSRLHAEVQQAANLGLPVFPVPEVARLTGRPESLIAEATSDICRLEELASEYASCAWHAAAGMSRFCVVRVDGMRGAAWFAAKNDGLDNCCTLSVVRGDIAWGVFQWPAGLVLRAWAKALAPGVRILADGDSFPVPPSGGATWANLREPLIESVPYWMRELAFEPPDSPLGKEAPAPSRHDHPEFSRSFARLETFDSSVRKGHPSCNQAGWKGGFRVSRCR